MDRVTTEITITGSLCNRIRERADADVEAWERFTAEVRELADRPEYASLGLTVHDR
ncbi:hypothetical protein ABT023_26115 [Micromonospora sp. NPDC002296]|uniref:hypothetical protein n=1 Tax=Micromonospora sp. NPDC002296 TaxID=3154271 RepID=UPI00332CB25C